MCSPARVVLYLNIIDVKFMHAKQMPYGFPVEVQCALPVEQIRAADSVDSDFFDLLKRVLKNGAPNGYRYGLYYDRAPRNYLNSEPSRRFPRCAVDLRALAGDAPFNNVLLIGSVDSLVAEQWYPYSSPGPGYHQAGATGDHRQVLSLLNLLQFVQRVVVAQDGNSLTTDPEVYTEPKLRVAHSAPGVRPGQIPSGFNFFVEIMLTKPQCDELQGLLVELFPESNLSPTGNELDRLIIKIPAVGKRAWHASLSFAGRSHLRDSSAKTALNEESFTVVEPEDVDYCQRSLSPVLFFLSYILQSLHDY